MNIKGIKSPYEVIGMEILRMILAERLGRGELNVVLDRETYERLEHDCFAALGKIRAVLADDGLEDPECFERIERIVSELELLGLDCGGRHDFG